MILLLRLLILLLLIIIIILYNNNNKSNNKRYALIKSYLQVFGWLYDRQIQNIDIQLLVHASFQRYWVDYDEAVWSYRN